MRRLAAVLLALAALLAVAAATAQGATPTLRAGVARVDITPPTGSPLGGWVRADRLGNGVHTRLYATALVLRRGNQKVALVAASLFAVPGGLQKAAAERVADRGFSEQDVLISATHTHAGPSGFANFATLNTVAPSPATATDPQSFANFLSPAPAEPRLYTFLVERIAKAVRQADVTARAASAAWGTAKLAGVTRNRSIEQHLANHDIVKEPRTGHATEDPDGVEHTIDPEVALLRVDRLARGRGGKLRRIPIGGWTVFANHGTVNPSELQVYNADHHGPALQVLEAAIRKAGRVRDRRGVVVVYGNGNEGDQSAGLDGQGPVVAERVGRAEAAAVLRAWRAAGRRLTRRPALGVRWTRTCFCGQQTAAGRVADSPVPGVPFLTGSEEGRGPLFDLTGVPLEGIRAPSEGFRSHGHKLGLPITGPDDYPTAVPLMVVRVADRAIASLPAEPTVEVGRQAKAAVLAAAKGTGIKAVSVSGLTNEFIQYLTTPKEYDRQHYEGGSTIFGPASSTLLADRLGDLTTSLVRGTTPPEAFRFDPRNGVRDDGGAFGTGAHSATATTQPAAIPPGSQAVFGWTGGAQGLDRPLDTPFITIERRTPSGWARVADDLGLQLLWRIAGTAYTATWEAPAAAPAGEHRFVVTANGYRLESRPFAVDPAAPATSAAPFTLKLGG